MHHFTDRETESLKSEVLFLRGNGAITKKTPISNSLHVTWSLQNPVPGDKHFNFLVISAGRMGMSKVGSI